MVRRGSRARRLPRARAASGCGAAPTGWRSRRRRAAQLAVVLDGFEVGDHLVGEVRERGRYLHAHAELILGLVDHETAVGRGERVLEEGAARRAVVTGEEIAAVLLLGHVGEAEALDPALEVHLVVLVGHVPGPMVRRALREVPRPRPHAPLVD